MIVNAPCSSSAFLVSHLHSYRRVFIDLACSRPGPRSSRAEPAAPPSSNAASGRSTAGQAVVRRLNVGR